MLFEKRRELLFQVKLTAAAFLALAIAHVAFTADFLTFTIVVNFYDWQSIICIALLPIKQSRKSCRPIAG